MKKKKLEGLRLKKVKIANINKMQAGALFTLYGCFKTGSTTYQTIQECPQTQNPDECNTDLCTASQDILCDTYTGC